jgi:hypothetical protein
MVRNINTAMQQEPIDWRYLPFFFEAENFKAYVREYPHKIWSYMGLTYLHFRIPKFPLIIETGGFQKIWVTPSITQ